MTCAFSLLDRDVSLKVLGRTLEFRPVCLFLVVGFFLLFVVLDFGISHKHSKKLGMGMKSKHEAN